MSLASLNVPERYRNGIVQVAKLSEDGYSQLLAALKKAPEFSTRKELLAWLKGETPATAAAAIYQIIIALSSMLRVQRGAKVSRDDFAQDVWDSLAEDAPESIGGLDGKVLRERIAELLANNSLDIASSRVNHIRSEVERSFCGVHVFTDLRPVFRDEEKESRVTELVAIHNFQIAYHDGMGKHHEFYLSLDAEDLKTLKKAIIDAENKTKTLQELLKPVSVSFHE